MAKKHVDDRPEIAEEAAAEVAYQKTQDHEPVTYGKSHPEHVVKPHAKKPFILVEEPTGGAPYELEVPEAVGLERAVTVSGVRYEHCAEHGGVWVYRAMAT
jgi:hypothetical protein